MVFPKFAGLLEIRIGGLPEIIFIAAERVMFPIMLAIPGVRGVVPFPAHAAGDVVRGADGEAAPGKLAIGGLEFLRRLRRLAPRWKLAVHQIKQRPRALGEIRRLGEPVIHLDVDVRVIIGMPRRIVAVVPKPLQVRGQSTRTRTGNQQVTAVLEKQFFELWVNRGGRENLALVGGQGDLSGERFSEIECDAVEQGMEISFMRGLERVVIFCRSFSDLLGYARVRVFAAIIFCKIHRVIRSGCDDEREAVAV